MADVPSREFAKFLPNAVGEDAHGACFHQDSRFLTGGGNKVSIPLSLETLEINLSD